ncbi:MAG TPA: hypothetical protein VFK70_17155 [Vicinamibacteria bacterium]|nr:hypothetical protein [Vicinamibacteria bacterium]
MQPEGLLSAREAARRLEIRLPTLYAYVSRGLLRSVPGSGGAAACTSRRRSSGCAPGTRPMAATPRWRRAPCAGASPSSTPR